MFARGYRLLKPETAAALDNLVVGRTEHVTVHAVGAILDVLGAYYDVRALCTGWLERERLLGLSDPDDDEDDEDDQDDDDDDEDCDPL